MNRKHVKIFVVLLLMFSSCTKRVYSKGHNEKGESKHQTVIVSKSISSEEAKGLIEDRALLVLKYIKNKDLSNLSNFVHPEKGVRFGFFIGINNNELVFTSDDLKTFFEDESVIYWGDNIFTSQPINDTKKNIFSRVAWQDYTKAKSITFNNPTKKHGYPERYQKDYPESIVVECFYEGKNKDFDWKGKRVVFQKYNEEWYIVGFHNSFWTP